MIACVYMYFWVTIYFFFILSFFYFFSSSFVVQDKLMVVSSDSSISSANWLFKNNENGKTSAVASLVYITESSTFLCIDWDLHL